MKPSRTSSRAFILLAFCMWCAPCGRAATITWTNTAGGQWETATNWSPNQVPGTNDDAYITTPGTYSVRQISYSNVVNSLTIGGAGSGVQTLIYHAYLTTTTVTIDSGGVLSGAAATGLFATTVNINTGGLLSSPAILSVTNATVNEGGILEVTSTFSGALTVGAGGVLQAGNSFGGSSVSLNAQVTINNGGELKGRLQGLFIGDESIAARTQWLTVQAGGRVDLFTGTLGCLSSLTNAGTINLTNCYIVELAQFVSVNGSIVNQPGGQINLWGPTIFSTYPNDLLRGPYLINQGSINFAAGSVPPTTIGKIILNDFDLSQGTITTQPGFGTLQVGVFYSFGGPMTNLVGTYNAAAGTTIQLLAWTNLVDGTYASPGTPLTIGGSGRCEFFGGLLLPLNPVPGLVLSGGNLELGPGFQGGSITNLSLNGIHLGGSNTITGTLAATNSLLGPLTVANGGLLLLVNGGGGGQVTIENGGQVLALGSGRYINPLIVQSGGLAVLSASNLACLSPITNAGAINMTNCSLLFYDPGNPASPNGALVNQAEGVVSLWQNSRIYGPFAGEYLINEGTISSPGPTGSCSLSLSNIDNQGLISVEHGTFSLQSANLNLQSSGTLRVGLSSPADYGNFSINPGTNGTAPLGGALAIVLNGGYLPAVGSTFTVVSYGSFSGNFAGFSYPPAGIVWQPNYGSSALTLSVQPAIALTGPNLTLNVNGTPGQQAVALMSGDLTLPRQAWTPIATNTFDATGFLNFTTSLSPPAPRAFFTVRFP